MKSMTRLISVFFALVLVSISSAYAQQRTLTNEAEQRVALVIGNSAYETAPLKNPVNDASDIAQALRELGFDTIHKENVRQNDMKRVIREFGEKARNSSVALFYYAGHAVQVNGQNYLIPVGAIIEKEEEVEYESVDVGFVLAQMANAGSRTNIVILDACRNDPFARSFRSTNRGLALINAPSGTLVAYATAPGSVASDGTGRNGLYTQELLKNLGISGLDVEEVFKRVRVAVRERTQGKQTPWESSSLVGNFYFKQPSAQVIFEEHFNNNNRGWLQFSNNDAQFAVTDGGFVMESKGGGWWVASKPIAISEGEDFKIECKVTRVEGVDNFGYGLIWGIKDSKNYYYFVISGDGKFTVTRVREGVVTRLIPWATPNSINRFNSTNKLTIETKGSQMRFFINDSFAGKVQFEPFFGDGVGFTLWNKQKIIFDDLVVTTQSN
jgi:hypothetical protein